VKNLKCKVGEKFVDKVGAIREIIDIDENPPVGEEELIYELDRPFSCMNWVSEECIDYNFKSYNQKGDNKKFDKLINGFDETMELEG